MKRSEMKELLRKGIELKRKIAKAQKKLDGITQTLVEEAEAKRGGDKSVTLSLGEDDVMMREGTKAFFVPSIAFTWSPAYKVDYDMAVDLKEELGTRWKSFFSEKRPAISRSRSYNKSIDDLADQKLAKRIGEAVDVVPAKKPSIKWDC